MSRLLLLEGGPGGKNRPIRMQTFLVERITDKKEESVRAQPNRGNKPSANATGDRA